MNSLAEDVVGFSAEEIATVDIWFREVFSVNEAEARHVYAQARERGFPHPDELTITRKDGSTRLVEFSGYFSADEEVWFLRDVTEVLAAEQALRDRERRLEATVELTGLATWEWDLESGAVVRHEGAARLFGLSDDPENAAFEAYLNQIHSVDRPRVGNAIAMAVETRGSFNVTFRVRLGDERQRWLHMHGAVVDDPPNAGLRVIGATHDITEEKRIDEQLIDSARMESLGRLAGGIAHDFNNLLAVIQGHVEFLGQTAEIPADAGKRISSIGAAAARGADLVSDLMGLSRPIHDGASTINLNEVVRREADTLRQLLGEAIAVETCIGAAEPYVEFDPARLQAVLLNLATNARDAMPEGGTVTITTTDLERPTDPRHWSQQGGVLLTFRDTGVGMSEDVARRVFEPFYTTKAPGVGTGLGLATAYAAVNAVGGRIEVDSTLGAGTLFTITLPRLETGASPPVPSRGMGSRGRAALVLVVDDDAEVLELTADILRSNGHRVLEALGAGEALDYVERGEMPEVLVADVRMPDLTGPQLAARLTERLPGLKVIFISGYTSQDLGSVSVDSADLIRKPFSHQHLLDRVAALLS